MRKFWMLLLVSACLYSCKDESVRSTDELLQQLTPAVQQKTIDPSIDNLVEGAKGVRVFIPAKSLVFEDGTSATGQVTVSLEEFLSAADFFSRKLSTVSGSKLLETGGMIHITATSAGKPLKLADAEAMIIALPATDTLPGMEAFYGSVNDSTSGGPADWIPYNQLFRAGAISQDTSLIDSSLYSSEISVCGYLAAANGNDIEWKIQHPDSTIFKYVENNLGAELKAKLCEAEPLEGMILSIDSSGKITDIRPGYEGAPPAMINTLLPFFKNMPPFYMSSMNTGSVETDYTLSLCCYKQIDPARYKEKFERKYAFYKDMALKAIGNTEIRFYLLTSQSLGWINCDRFYKDPSPKIDFVVTTAGVANPQVMLIFENIKSVLQAEEKDGRFIFRNIPVNSKIKIVSTGQGKDRALLAVQSTTVSSSPFKLEGYASFSLDEFQQKLK